MPGAIAGIKFAGGAISGRKFAGGVIAGGKFAAASTDTAGVLTINAVRASRGATIGYSIADADGIRAVTSVVMIAGDDTRSEVTSEIARSDANTFTGSSRRLNNKWRVGSMTITYTDATSGASHTLTQTWSI